MGFMESLFWIGFTIAFIAVLRHIILGPIDDVLGSIGSSIMTIMSFSKGGKSKGGAIAG